jgi:hypothetical protein
MLAHQFLWSGRLLRERPVIYHYSLSQPESKQKELLVTRLPQCHHLYGAVHTQSEPYCAEVSYS